jgi:hypothetical protein
LKLKGPEETPGLFVYNGSRPIQQIFLKPFIRSFAMSGVSQFVPIVRSELQKLASSGRITYYKELGEIIGKPPRWNLWKSVLDEISYTKPDITILVLNSKTGWPSQIAYKFTDGKPTDEQKKFAQDELTKVFQRYCPTAVIPKLPIPK